MCRKCRLKQENVPDLLRDVLLFVLDSLFHGICLTTFPIGNVIQLCK